MYEILACHDGSFISNKGLEHYLEAKSSTSKITLFHVLEPIPPDLAEHGGRERPDEERKASIELEHERRDWLKKRISEANKTMQRCLDIMRGRGFQPAETAVKIVPSYSIGDFLPLLEDEVKNGNYDEVVLVHHQESWLKNLLKATWADKASRKILGVKLTIISCSEKDEVCEV